MPNFIFDVQGLETTFGPPAGCVHAVVGAPFHKDESGSMVFISNRFGIQETNGVFPVIRILGSI